jgi:predicted nucleotidyltransferase
MNTTFEHDLNAIKTAVLANTPVEKIYLFGSYAYGTPREESDIDVCVVIPDDGRDAVYFGTDIRSALYKKITMPFDLVISKKSIFAQRTKVPGIEQEISEKGVAIYG